MKIVDLGAEGVLLQEMAQKRDPWKLFEEGIADRAISTARYLVTHNRSEFSRIERLHWEDWKSQ